MANIELDGGNKKITVDSGDLTLDIPGDIILDADGGDLVFADGGTNLLKVTNSSSDVVVQPQVDAKDIKFNQYDGRTLLDVNDGGFIGIANGATGPGQLRLYEDTDNGTNYTALQVGTQSGDITYTLPTADGSNGHALTTNGSGTLSWASAGTTYAGIDDQSSSNDDQLTISDTAVIINEDSDDLDFRVESNGNANMLFISGGNDVVGVGAEGDLGVGLHIKSADSGASVDSAGDELVIEGSGASGMTILSGTSSSGSIYFGDSGDNDIGYVAYNHSTNALMLGANTGEGLRVTGDGVVSIGTTETDYSNLTQHSDNGIILTDGNSSIIATSNGVPIVIARTNNDTNNRDMIIFNRAGSTQGEISAGNNNVNYGSNSDYRLKENVTYTWDATTRLKQLKPARFNFITDETNTLRDGFIAHEVSSIVPEAISGEKDGMAVETMYTADDVETQGDNPSKKVGDTKTYSSSEIKAQTIDASKLVPLLVKTIQELEVRIKTLEDA